MRKFSQNQTRDFMDRIPKHLKRLDYNDLKIACNEYFQSLPFPIMDFTNEKFFFRQREHGGLNMIFRARHITNIQNRPHEELSEISHIPDDKLDQIKYFGRANKPNESMFYGSLNFPTACTEAVCKGNVFENTNSTMLTVGVWKFETPLKLVELPHSEKYFKEFYKTVSFKSERIQLEHIQKSNEALKSKIGNDFDFEKLMFFADHFAKWDIKNDWQYKLSNYFVDRVLNRIPDLPVDEEIDGIIYPSLALSYQEKNIVLKPEVVEHKLSFFNAMQVWFISHMEKGEGAQFIPIQQGIKSDKNGKLQWRL